MAEACPHLSPGPQLSLPEVVYTAALHGRDFTQSDYFLLTFLFLIVLLPNESFPLNFSNFPTDVI